MRVRQAIFLVGGKGTRLGVLTAATPKPLLEIAPGLRFLDVILEEAARHGFDDILLLAGHLGEQVEDAYQGKTIRGAKVSVVREPEPQGTGGALAFAKERLAPAFLMANGDSLFEFNLRALAQPLGAGLLARLALRQVPDPGRYGSVTLDGCTVTGFTEKNPHLPGPALINGGVYLMRREILNWISGPCAIEQDVFPKLAAERRLTGARFDGYFIDVGLPDTLAQAQREVPARRIRPCLFLARDRLLNHNFPQDPERLRWMEGARTAVRLANDAGYYVIVYAHNARPALGEHPENQMSRFHAAIVDDLAAEGAHVDAWCDDPYPEEDGAGSQPLAVQSNHRPRTSSILRALAEWPIARERSLLVAGEATDLAAADMVGVRSVAIEGKSLFDVVRAELGQMPI